jgi:putative DNA primase/helicase
MSAQEQDFGPESYDEMLGNPASDDKHDSRPVIIVNAHPDEPFRDIADVTKDAECLLGNHGGNCYARAGELADVGPVDVFLQPGDKRQRASLLGIRTSSQALLLLRLAEAARWQRWQYSQRTRKPELVRINPPTNIAASLASLGRWQHIRPIDGVLSSPSIRPDGTVLQEEGWDSATRYVLHFAGVQFPSVPDQPTLADARAALAQLQAVFAPADSEQDGFPFVSPSDALVPIAALFSLLARPAIEGPVPAFVFDASSPGSGKTLLADVVCLIATGNEMPKATFPEQPDELEKMLGALALAGVAIAGFDNLDQRTPFRGAALDKVLTSTTPTMRILGRSEMPTVQWRAVTIATGNNVRIEGDTTRRCLRSRQEPDTERPEARSNFVIPDLRKHCRERRGELVAAALTVLRAHSLSGRQAAPGRARLGSYEAWQAVVSDALQWVTGVDLLTCRVDSGQDPEREAAATVIEWLGKYGLGVTAAKLVEQANDGPMTFGGQPVAGQEYHPELKEALLELAPSKHQSLVPRLVGVALRRYEGRVMRGYQLRLLKVGPSSIWTAKPPRA